MSTNNNSSSLPIKSQSYLMAERCVRRDLDKLKIGITSSSIIFADPIGNDYLHLEAAIFGPQSTPYENGIFLLDIKLPEQYPFLPPISITFKRATMHPNVNEYGGFISELLKPESWSPAFTIKNILEHVWARLAVPDIDSNECDLVRAVSYKTGKEQFEMEAREYSIKYATAT